MAKNLLIIDSHALIYRAYYAFPPTLSNSKGESLNAVFGYASLLLDVLTKFTPTHVIAVLDSGEPIERQAEFTQYKANREKTDDLLIQQIPRIEELISSFNIPFYKVNGIEADDIIATIDHKFADQFDRTIVVTGDQDLLQLVDNDTFVYLTGRRFSESKLFDASMVREKLGVDPIQIPDYKSLAGDSSDNIPGVKGIGPKTACGLIDEFGQLEKIYENLDRIPPKVSEKLINDQEIAFLSKKLATSDKDVPLSINIDDSTFATINAKKVKALFKELEFRSLEKKLDNVLNRYIPQDSDSLLGLGLEESKSIELKEWEGEEIAKGDIFFTVEVNNSELSPLNWRIDKLHFFVSGSQDILEVTESYVHSFFLKHSSRNLFTFDLKKTLHSLKNIKFDEELSIKDLGIYGYIIAGGRSNYSLNGILNFFGVRYEEDLRDLLGFEELKKKIDEKLNESPRLRDLSELEHTVMYCVIEMEKNGIGIDLNMFKELKDIFTKDKESLERDIYQNAGHEFNINSPKQVADVLFVEKSLPSFKKTKGGSFSTDERVLRDLIGVDPIVENILRYRETDKVIGTYINPLPEYVDKKTGKIHAIFDQLGAVSGRFSSRNPNMQNIPKGEVVEVNIRDGFVSEADSIFVSVDFSQQELRILAALSGEKVMIESFNKEQDVHRLTASEMFGISESEVTKAQRDIGKTINFSIIYGISAFGLSDRMKISREQASEFIKKYYENYTKVKEFMDKSLEDARKNTYVETILGRRRYSKTINSNNRNLRAAAERELFNLIIQGSAADIMKIAMSKLDNVLNKFPAKLLLQIHDEFLFEFKLANPSRPAEEDTKLIEFAQEVSDIMNNAYDLGVKYKVEVSVGKRWGSLETLGISK
jgi:DNA polymerase-1